MAKISNKNYPDLRDLLIMKMKQMLDEVEHYEMAAYSAMIDWADLLELNEISDLFTKSRAGEEGAADKLTDLATSKLNEEAMGEDENAME